jgi:hypothetical protein
MGNLAVACHGSNLGTNVTNQLASHGLNCQGLQDLHARHQDREG